MPKRGRPSVEIVLSDAEKRQLESWARRHTSAQALALRCKIVLACAEGDQTQTQIAEQLGCNPATVGKWRNRFVQDRLDGLADLPRPGAQRTVSDEIVDAIVTETLETTPKDATHWSTRSLAQRHGISHSTVAEIWRAFGLKPWKQDSFNVSPDPLPVDKIRDLAGRLRCRGAPGRDDSRDRTRVAAEPRRCWTPAASLRAAIANLDATPRCAVISSRDRDQNSGQ